MAITLSSKSRTKKKLTADEELIEQSFKHFKITAEAESDTRKQGMEDLKFSIGTGQWDSAVKANREIEGKPCLTVNRAPSFLRQYTGEERQHRPAMLVSPVGDGADADVAKIQQGVLRHIEVVSSADVVYDNAYDWMMRTGWSHWRIKTDYLSETSFDQEPRIEWIENAFAVYMSPIRKPDGTDPLWCHVVEDLGKDEYEAKYGKTQLVKLRFPSSLGNAEPGWVTKDGARVAEYWWIELKQKTLVQLDDGSIYFKDQLKGKRGKKLLEQVVGERETVTRKVCCVKHDAMQVLERNEYIGKYIPILELNGVRLNIDGRIHKAGMIRDYRDAQRIYDFMTTRAVEQVDLTGKDPLYVAEGSIAGHEEEYRQMNRKNYPYMYYKAFNADGQPLPPPTRANREPPIQAMMEVIKQADYDMKAVIGIYGPGLGEQGPENESGFAILSRQQQSDTGMVTWHDNLNRAICYQGKVLLDLYPKLIDRERIQRIINPDDSVKHEVVYNSRNTDPEQAQLLIDGEAYKKIYDVGVGDYDVVLSAGPQYRTARQEAFRALTAVIQAQPELISILGDIWAKNGDFPDSHVVSDRFKKMLPPQLQDQDANDPKTQIQALQSQLAALGQQHQQLVAELGRASDAIRTDRLNVESRERIALMNNQTQLTLQMLKSEGAAAQSHLQAQLDAIQHRLEMLHESMSVEQEAGQPPVTPELPGKVEPKVQPITPAAPIAPVPGTAG